VAITEKKKRSEENFECKGIKGKSTNDLAVKPYLAANCNGNVDDGGIIP